MFNSLEVRSPFLNHKLVNKAFELPIEFKLRNKTHKIYFEGFIIRIFT